MADDDEKYQSFMTKVSIYEAKKNGEHVDVEGYVPPVRLPEIERPAGARTVPTGAPRFVYGEAEAA